MTTYGRNLPTKPSLPSSQSHSTTLHSDALTVYTMEIQMTDADPMSESPFSFSPSFLAALDAAPTSAIPRSSSTKNAKAIPRRIPQSHATHRPTIPSSALQLHDPVENSTARRRIHTIERHKSQGRHLLLTLRITANRLGPHISEVISPSRLSILRRLFCKYTTVPGSEVARERDRRAREEGMEEIERAIEMVEVLRGGGEGERRRSI